MFSNLQNKIDLRKIKDDVIEIDSEFIFKEDFDIVNQTLSYFQNKSAESNNIVIKEEVTEFEDKDLFDFIEKTVQDEQKFIYNDENSLKTLKDEELIDGGRADGKSTEDLADKHDVPVGDIEDQLKKGIEVEQEHVGNDKDNSQDEEKAEEIAKDHLDEFPDYYDRLSDMEEKAKDELVNESYNKYHRQRKILPLLMEEANNDLRAHFDAYRMVGTSDMSDEEFAEDNNEYSLESLFDRDILDLAKHEYLDQIHTVNWLEKQLVQYRNDMKDHMMTGGMIQIDNGLKKLDVNDTDEIKNKIKDLNESVKFLKMKKVMRGA